MLNLPPKAAGSVADPNQRVPFKPPPPPPGFISNVPDPKISDNILPSSNLYLQTLIYFDHIYTWMYFIFEFLIFIYKGFNFFYPPNQLGLQIFILVCFWIAQLVRISIGDYGNQTEKSEKMSWFLYISFPVAFSFAFFLASQTYVIMIQEIIGAIGVIFLFFQFILGAVAYSTFSKNQSTT